MVDEPAYIRNLRAITRANPQAQDVDDIDRELYSSGSDRATAVMLGSSVETNLEHLLIAHMRADLNSQDRRRLFEFDGAVSSFSSKIIVAYALKLLGPMCRFDLDLIRFLRNEFAHSRMHFNFETPEVRAVCDQLKVIDMDGNYIPPQYINGVAETERAKANDLKHPKTRYISTCHNISHRMWTARARHIEGGHPFSNNPLP